MASKIKHLRSSVSGKNPTAGQLEEGQIALNTADGKVFMKKADSTIREITKQIHDEDTQVFIDESGANGKIVFEADATNVAEVTAAAMNIKVPVVIEDNDSITIRESSINGTSGVVIKVPTSLANTYNFTLPPTPGTAGQILKTDGNGTLTFEDPSLTSNMIMVDVTTGNDNNDGLLKPVASIKRACEIASGLIYSPKILPTDAANDAIQLLTLNKSFIQAEVIAYIEYQIANTGGIWAGFTYDDVTCSRDTGYIVDAVIYDLKYGGNSKSIEAGKSYYRGTTSTEEVINNQKPQTLAAIDYARHIAADIIRNIALTDDQDGNVLAPFQSTLTQVIDVTYDEGATVLTTHNSLWDEVLTILDLGTNQASPVVYGQFNASLVTIKIGTGEYLENNPIIVPDNVSIMGDSLRSVIIRPENAQKDMFRVRNAVYASGFTFRDKLNANGVPISTYNFAVGFDDVEDYTVNRHSYADLPIKKPLITISPYVQNCSIISFLGGNGCNVDGSKVFNPNTPLNQIESENPVAGDAPLQNPSMVGNAFTILSFGGTGYRVTNNAYSQIVSCFQIFCKNGSYAQSGGYLSITNSATNFGTYALRSSGFRTTAFTFDRGIIATNGVDGLFQTFDVIGFKKAPTEHYVTRFVNTNGDDVTDNYKSSTVTLPFSANSSTVNTANNKFVITAHGLSNGDRVRYNSNENPDIFGIYDETYYYVSLINDDEFQLFEDEELTNLAELGSTSSGTHQFISGDEEFFIQEIKNAHSTYQTIVLDPGTYNFTVGQEITGTVSGNTNNAYVYSWNAGTRTLVVSINQVVVNGVTSYVKFTADSTIDVDANGNTNIAITSVTNKTDLFSAKLLIRSTQTSGQVANIAQLPGFNLYLHRPSIVNSSAHTWEYAGSGTDYNALPINGGLTNADYEQYQDLPGRVYTSGTSETGDFKVGRFITAQNRTGNVTFTNKVSIAQLDSLQLSLSDVTIEAISTDPTLGDNDPGGASHGRLTTQLAQRTFMNNRLGDFLDKQVTSSSVPGAVVQLNSSGKINPDLIPPIRTNSNFTLDQFEERLSLYENIPADEVLSGDNIIEAYSQEVLTLTDPITVVKGETITQANSGATGIVKVAVTSGSSVTLVTALGTFTTNPADTLSGSTSGALSTYPASTTGAVSAQDNYFLSTDSESQFLIISDPQDSTVHNFQIGSTVRGANTLAEGVVTEYREGVAIATNTGSLSGGSGYGSSGTYVNVLLTGGTGTGVKADITVDGTGTVSSVDLVRGGTGYSVGDTLSASDAALGGRSGGSAFTINLASVENRLYVDLSGNFIKFEASVTTNEFIEDNNADIQSFLQAAFTTITFSANPVNNEIDYTLNRVIITDHGLINGDPIEYNANGNTEIGNLSNDTVYFAKKIDDDTFEVYSSYSLSPASQVNFGSSSTGSHVFRVRNVSVSGDRIFLPAHSYTTGTALRLIAATPPSGLTNGNFYFVGSVTTNSFTLHTLRNDAVESVNGVTQSAVVITATNSGTTNLRTQNARIVGTINTSSNNPDNYSSLNSLNIDASNIVSGIISASRLGTGIANQNTALSGDGTYQKFIKTMKVTTGNPISIVGDSVVEGGETVFYGDLQIQVDPVDPEAGDLSFTNLGVAAFSKEQFVISEDGEVSIKSTAEGGELDATTLGGQQGSYYLNPENNNRALPITKGGTNLTGYTAGDMLYAAANLSLNTDSLNTLAIGPPGTVLKSNGSIPEWTSTISLGSLVIDDNFTVDTDTLYIDSDEHKIGINNLTPAVIVDITATDAIRIPVGTTIQRPLTLKQGYIRYNTTNNTFEGYNGNAWVQLQGVKDVDGDTYISAETSPGSNDNTLKFYAGDVLVAELNSNGFADVKVGDILIEDSLITTTASNSNLVLSAAGTGTINVQNLLAVDAGAVLEGEVVINESGSSTDLRVETNTQTHALFVDGSADAVGIQTSAPKAPLQVQDYAIDVETTTNSGTNAVKIAEWAIADFRTAKVIIQVTNSTDGEYQAQEMMIVHNSTNNAGVKSTEYAVLFTGSAALATFSTQVSGGNIELLATPSTANTLVYKVAKTMITV
jgi:hypothetical protein